MKKYVIKSCDRAKWIVPLIEEITAGGLPEGAEIVYRARNTVYKMLQGDRAVSVKAFRRPNFINKVIYATLRKGKARRSFENASCFASLGLGTPQPLGYGEVRQGCLVLESYYLSRHIQAQEMRHWEEKADCLPLLKAFAREMVKLHRANVLHKDFSPGNILYTGNAEEGYRFYYVDLNRMEFGVKSRKKLMSMFRSINLDEKETARLAELYARAAGEDIDKTVAEAVGCLNKYLKSRSRRAKAKKLMRRFTLRG